MFNAGGAGGCGSLSVFMNFPHLPQPKTDLREVRAVAPRGYGGAAAPQTFRISITATLKRVKYGLTEYGYCWNLPHFSCCKISIGD